MDERPDLARLLLERFRWMEDGLLAALERAGWPSVRRSHSLVFAHLDLERGTRESELARRIGVTRQSVHQIVMDLRDLGLIELVPDPTNRSAKLVRPTARGRRQVTDARQAFAELEGELEQRIGSARVRGLRLALEAEWGPPPRG